MVNIRVKVLEETPKTQAVAEIDTAAPFQSVKAAVNLFRDAALSRQKSAPPRSRLFSEASDTDEMSEEANRTKDTLFLPHNPMEKETQLLLAEQELERIQQTLNSSETAKARALADLERAQRTVADLTSKLDTLKNSRLRAIEAKEALKRRVEQLELEKSNGVAAQNEELEHARQEYIVVTADLDVAKEELSKMRQDFNVALEARLTALQQAEDAQCTVMVNSEKMNKMSKEIAEMKDAIEQLRSAEQTNKQKHKRIIEENKGLRSSYSAAIQEANRKLDDLKLEYDPQVTRDLEEKLAEITADIEILQEEIKRAHSSETNSDKDIIDELNSTTDTLHQVSDEECSYRSLVSSLSVELDEVKKEHAQLKDKQAERQALEEQKQHDAHQMVQEILSEAERTKNNTEEMNQNAEGLRQEAEATQIVMHEAAKQLELVLKAVEKAKDAEKRALEDMKLLTDKQENLKKESDSKLRISLQEFETLKGRPEESEKLVETKVASVAAQLEEINSSKAEADKKLEADLKALEEIKAATDMALRQAEIAEAAHSAVDAELQKWKPEA